MDVTRDLGGVLYDVPVVELSAAGVQVLEKLRAADTTGASEWYLSRRGRALRAAGLVSAGWDPSMHPRGHDGKFISTGGFVRWLQDGIWRQGKVNSIDSDGVHVSWDKGSTGPPHGAETNFDGASGKSEFVFKDPKNLWSVPKPKATLKLPNPTGEGSENWKKIGGQGGSNPGGLFQLESQDAIGDDQVVDVALDKISAPNVGDKYYVKKAKSPDHARTEALAGDLYEAAGVAVPEVSISEGGSRIASKIVESSDQLSLTQAMSDPALMSRIREDLVVDAWLANWDSVGLEYDNMKVVNGVPYRVDAGGALTYRAMGSPKGAHFGVTVGELDTLRNPSMNPQAAKVFGPTTDEELRRGAERIAAISPQQIRDMVDANDLDSALAAKLIARRSDVLKKVGVADPHHDNPPVAEKPDPHAADPDALAYTDSATLPKTTMTPEEQKLLEGVSTSNYEPTPAPSPAPVAAPAPPPDAPSATKTGSTPDLVSTKLPIAGAKLDPATIGTDADALTEEWRGRVVIVTNKNATSMDGYNAGLGSAGGIMVVDKVQAGYSGKGVIFTGKSQNGVFIQGDLSRDGISVVPLDLKLKPMPPPTMRKDGTIVAGGVVVGTWKKKNYYSSQRVATIHPDYSMTGKPTTVTSWGVSDLKSAIGVQLLPPSISTRPKASSPAHAEVQQKIVDAASPSGPSAGKLVDGADAQVGQWVKSLKDGLVGKIVKVPDQTKYPGHTQVQMEDGSLKSRNVKNLASIPNPTATAPSPAPSMYGDLKMSDGNAPAVGQVVTAGKGAKTITGVVTKVKTAQGGWMEVEDAATGKRLWRKVDSATLVTPAAANPVAQAHAVAGDDLTVLPSKPKPLGLIKYPAPGGATITQDSEILTQWIDEEDRKPTKDGYAPQVGMRLRGPKGESYLVVELKDKYAANSSSVRVEDVATGETKWRTVSSLYVDHEAELTQSDGTPLPKVAAFGANVDMGLPDGSYIFEMKKMGYLSGRSKPVELTFYVGINAKTGEAKSFNKPGSYSSTQPLVFAPSKYQYQYQGAIKSKKKIAVVDGDARLVIGVDNANDDQVGITYDPTSTSFETALAAHNDAIAQAEAALTGLPAPLTVGSTSLTPLPKPQVAGVKPTGPKVPVVTGVKADLKTLPAPLRSAGAQSVSDAFVRAIDEADSKEPGSGVHYALGDSDYVEDMTYRTQMVRENGKDYVELRFGLLEDRIDALSDQIVMPTNATLGAWANRNVGVKDLVLDDAIGVRLSTKGVIKPAEPYALTEPNARIASVPELIGKSKAGNDLYRTTIVFADGKKGEVDLEDRSTPSVQLFEFDPSKPAGSGGAVDLTPDAIAAGWSISSHQMGYRKNSKSKYVDETGAKHEPDAFHKMQTTGNGSKRVQRTLPSGATVETNITHTSTSKREPTLQKWSSEGRRSSANGDVTIRIPADSDDPDRDIAQLLEAVGIPPEKQGAPTSQDMARLAINTVHKQFSASYAHQDRANATGLAGDPGTAVVLNEVNTAIGTQLGRPVTLRDIEFTVDPNGHVRVQMSDDVADAITKRNGVKQYVHQYGHGADVEKLVNLIASPNNGLQGADERYSAGIFTSTYNTTSQDNFHDAGSRVFLRANKGVAPVNRIVFSPRAIHKKTGIYWRASDSFGHRDTNNTTWLSMSSPGGGNEMMVKRRLEPDDIAYVLLGSADRQLAIDRLKKQGITQINGRPVEDVIVSSPPSTIADPKSLTSISLDQLGADAATAPAGGTI